MNRRENNLAVGILAAPTIFEKIDIFRGRQITRQIVIKRKV
jgi:hypothetical protein